MSESQEIVVVTARFLADGAPAYLTASGSWSRAFQEAAVLSTDKGTEEATARGAREQRIVADPYTFKVAVREDSVLDPLSTRERIRAEGPSIRMRRPDR